MDPDGVSQADGAPTARPLASGVRWGAGLLALALALHVWPWWRHGADLWAWNTAINLIEIVVPAVAAALLARRWITERQSGWLWLASGAGAWALGQVGWTVLDLLGLSPSPSANDLLFMVWPVATCIGLVQLGIDRGRRGARLVVVTEALEVAVGAGFVLWALVLRPTIERSGSTDVLDEVVLAYFPITGIAVAATALLVRFGARCPALTSACAGAVAISFADAMLASDVDHDRLVTLLGGHLGWTLGFVLLGTAAQLPLAAPRRSAIHPTLGRLLFVSLPIGAALLVAAYQLGIQHRQLDPVSMGLTVIGALVLVTAQVLFWRESGRMSAQLQDNYRRITEAERELRSLLDSIAETVLVLDLEGRVNAANHRALQMLGMPADELVGRDVGTLIPTEARERVRAVLQQLAGGAEPIETPIFPVRAGDGRLVQVEANVALDEVRPDRVVLSLRDVSERVEAEEALRRAQDRFKVAFHSAPTGMAIVRPDDLGLVEVNGGLAAMLRTAPEQLVGRSLRQLVHPDELATAAGARTSLRLVRADDTVMWATISLAGTEDPFGQPMLIAHVQDVTEQRAATEQLGWSATHDEVTGLANRAFFLEQLDEAIVAAPQSGLAVLFLDLDRFKMVNDSLGHATGDDLLRVMAARLRGAVRDGDVVARFGGDEFTVLLRDARSACEIADRIRSTLAMPIALGDAELDVTVSVGVVIVDGARLEAGAVTADELVRDADAAMYRAKDQGRNRVEEFRPETRAAALRVLHTGNELRHGIERGEIVPYYQPIVELASGRLKGFEVVARWRHPDRGLLLPAEFLSIAEERGFIGVLGDAVLRASLAQLAQWRSQHPELGPLTIGVNLSARQLGDRRLIDTVAEALAETGVPAECLWLELTETALLSDVPAATVALRELRGLGLHLAVDDFGTGYSSLTYLKRFPIEAIKVDRTFVAGLGLDPDDSTIVDAVIRLGTSLGLTTIAEGVETPLQLARLREMGCGQAQGFLFGRPRPASMLEPVALAV
jgi:diguanylate cyclase (GGDEF)-like protein/PAS domain S-box-containing protein